MKRKAIELNFAVRQTLGCLIFLALLGNGIVRTISGQENEPQPQSGTAAKMRSVPETPAVQNKSGDEKQKLGAPRAGVISRARVRQNDAGRIVLMRGAVGVAGARNARDAADKFLNQNAVKFGIPSPVRTRGQASGLRVTDEIESLTGTHLTYRQFYNNLPVFDEQLKISVNKSLQVTDVAQDIETITARRGGSSIVKPGSRDEAIKAAIAVVNGIVSPSAPPAAEAGIVRRGGANPATVYRVHFDTSEPLASWLVFIDARTDEALSIENVAHYQSPMPQPTAKPTPKPTPPPPLKGTSVARILSPNPVVSSGYYSLLFDTNAALAQLDGQTKIAFLRDLTDGAQLTGTYANTNPTFTFPRARVGADGFSYSLTDYRFDEVMAYYWVTEATHYIHDIGFTKILNRSMDINVNGTTKDNSSYSSYYKLLTFGSGGVRDAQDASIILHEFGHAILDAQVPGFGGTGTEAGAISEGFGDYFAASYFSGYGAKGHQWDAYVGTWDGIAYNSPKAGAPGPAFLRRVDGAKVYPKDLDPRMEVHNNGEIWSSHLWKIFQKLGKRTADRLIIEAQFKLSPKATFKQNAKAIINTDRELNKGRNAAVLRQIFKERGIITGADDFDLDYML